MSRIGEWAREQPDKIACAFPDIGAALSYRELDARADRAAGWLVASGLAPGETIALLMENHPAMFEFALASQRAGLYYVPVSIHLKPAEIAYLLRDCGARVLVTTHAQTALAAPLASGGALDGIALYMIDGVAQGFMSYGAALAAQPAEAGVTPRPLGRDMLYSSGTTGMPKGIRRPLIPYEERHLAAPSPVLQFIFGCERDSIYLSPAPLYHAAPHRFTLHALERGATNIVLSRFAPEATLTAIARHRVTHSQFVPTMFVRMLALPEELRRTADISSMRRAIHAASPCPVTVKEHMIDWWGPILFEYYSGSEGIGSTGIDSDDWLRHKGSVGRSLMGAIHVLDEAGRDLPLGEVGTIWFEGALPFVYHNAPDKTAAAFNADGWATYGDLGQLDADGFLYLSDRRADLIISGGVNVYPQQVEDVLLRHPDVADAAVIGVPDAEFGEQVRAIVQPRDGAEDRLSDTALIEFCRAHLAHLKCPRRIDFVEALPRSETGKLLRRVLKDAYR